MQPPLMPFIAPARLEPANVPALPETLIVPARISAPR